MTQEAVSKIDLDSYNPKYERKFVPKSARLNDPVIVEELSAKLSRRELESEKTIEDWVMDRSEFEAAYIQTEMILRIRCDMDSLDEQRATDLEHFYESVDPLMKTWRDQLDRKYLEAREHHPTHSAEYWNYDRRIQTDVAIFAESNVELISCESLLVQKYDRIRGALTCEFEGEKSIPSKLVAILEEPSRERRESAWRSIREAYLVQESNIDSVFNETVNVRHEIAQNAGFESFLDYTFKQKHRFEYSPQDCTDFHELVRTHAKPILEEIHRYRREKLGVEQLRPWDVSVNIYKQKARSSKLDVDDIVDGCSKIFYDIDSEFGSQFSDMLSNGLVDLKCREGKVPGAFQAPLPESCLSFVFGNLAGSEDDIDALLHEQGHAFHSNAASEQRILYNRFPGMEFEEVASMSMELIGAEHLSYILSDEEIVSYRKEKIEKILTLLTWTCSVDSFQHWLYLNPDHTQDERSHAWLQAHNRFGSSEVDWSGLDRQQRQRWHAQGHFFQVPLYYIEYGFAQFAALQVWSDYRQAPRPCIERFKKALRLGGSVSLPDLYNELRAKFPFDAKSIPALCKSLADEYQSLGI